MSREPISVLAAVPGNLAVPWGDCEAGISRPGLDSHSRERHLQTAPCSM